MADTRTALFDEILTMETVDPSWREADLTKLSAPLLPIRIDMFGLELAFVRPMTAFQAPQNTNIEDIRIESGFPADAGTEAFFIP